MEATVLCLQRKTHYDTKHYATFMPNTSDSMQNVHFNGRNFKSSCLFLSTNGLEVLKSNSLNSLVQPSEGETCGLFNGSVCKYHRKYLNWHKSFLYFWTSYLYLFTPFFFFLFFLPNLNAFCRVKKQFGKCFLEHTFARVINLLWYLEITPLHKIHPTPTYVSD